MKLSKVSPEKAMLENLTSAVTVSNIVVRTVRNLSTCKTASNHSMQKSKGGRENVQHNGNVNRIEIVDNSGRVYIVLSIDSKDTEAKISLSGLVRGSYYIMIRDNNNILRYKQFIKE